MSAVLQLNRTANEGQEHSKTRLYSCPPLKEQLFSTACVCVCVWSTSSKLHPTNPELVLVEEGVGEVKGEQGHHPESFSFSLKRRPRVEGCGWL